MVGKLVIVSRTEKVSLRRHLGKRPEASKGVSHLKIWGGGVLVKELQMPRSGVSKVQKKVGAAQAGEQDRE